jgi:hypothetical protein
MISEDKFYEKSDKFALYPTTDGTYYLWNDLIDKIKPNQTDKDGKTMFFMLLMLTSNTVISNRRKKRAMKFYC